MFVSRGYKVEATKSIIIVYDEQGEEVFFSSFKRILNIKIKICEV